MSIVKLSKRTQNILKNFATINKSIVIDKGSTLRTLSVNKNIFASADITEAFPQQVAIYDLGVFLSSLSGFLSCRFLSPRQADIYGIFLQRRDVYDVFA